MIFTEKTRRCKSIAITLHDGLASDDLEENRQQLEFREEQGSVGSNGLPNASWSIMNAGGCHPGTRPS